MKNIATPVVLVLNKVDLIGEARRCCRSSTGPARNAIRGHRAGVGADGNNVDVLEGCSCDHLPEGEPLYPDDYLTDQPERFFVAEIVREQVLRHTHDELPFSTAVVVDQFDEARPRGPDARSTARSSSSASRRSRSSSAAAATMIKAIGTAARLELERFFETRVYLDLHVKVKAEWRDDERVLDELMKRPGE